MKACRYCGTEFEQIKGLRTTFYCSPSCRASEASARRRRRLAGETPPRICRGCQGPLPERATIWCAASACQERKRIAKHEARKVRDRDRRATDAAFREKNRQACAAWTEENRDLRREIDRQRYRADPSKAKAWARRRQVIKRLATVVPFTAAELAARLSVYDRCWICGDPRWTEADHVKPLAAGGPHMLANLRPACATCNRRKGATWPFPNPKGSLIHHAELR